MRQLVWSLPEWVLFGVGVLVLFTFVTGFAFGSVLVAELWRRTRVRFGLLVARLARRA